MTDRDLACGFFLLAAAMTAVALRGTATGKLPGKWRTIRRVDDPRQFQIGVTVYYVLSSFFFLFSVITLLKYYGIRMLWN
jgi:hypothetical protein